MTTQQKEFDMGNGLVSAPSPNPGSNMSTELVTVESNPLEVIQSIAAMAQSGQDPEKLLDFYERLQKNQAADAFGKAMTQFQAQCPVVHKARTAESSGKFQGYAYAAFEDVMKVAGPFLNECGLAISFSTETTDKGIRVTCRIRHGIHFEDHFLTVPIPSMNVNDTQRYGAALSYAKRYALCAALNIVVSDDIDDDAASLHESISDENAQEIERLLMETNSDIGKFCKAYAIDNIAHLPQSQYMQAITQIRRKMKS